MISGPGRPFRCCRSLDGSNARYNHFLRLRDWFLAFSRDSGFQGRVLECQALRDRLATAEGAKQ